MPTDALSGPKALGAFLRAHRERITPEMLGLPSAPRRRTSGLRREELAQISGISATWYTWIEQGRDVSISPDTLARIAQALRLGPAERHYLFTLARIADPAQEQQQETTNDALLQSVQQIAVPSYLLGNTWNIVAWNAQAEQLFCGWLDRADTPNLLHFMFFHPLAKTLVSSWDERAKRIVAEFRAETSHHQGTEEMRAFVRHMTQNSEAFNHWWQQHDVMAREGGEREFIHARQGRLRFRQMTFHPAENSGLKLVMLIPLP
ncbi:helix-turn-helix protein [Gibbsiella quercinecans]|uniref:DNA-binding protein n=1 Tax=Gibbsiella quercinecans TaxID=929813 RepID=A0A250AYZ7_9GAMM|nr:helix-turn-helix transcriptional regulator [Gibbsiella quercinecans]ATA19055.1 DNA-binding protein [Gibbsiella quercinecans]RLM03166.1 transcriptional regulator [Gibbsiella quercinecans]RLM03631.1 transcriptional regulator [Gibbsiella quercinecans]RLM07717.1 transcriptional regulator [Gibbsiella quercinecans]TCT82004.1 helix-turn-helix protein [Gibbsiella quercinecans]